MTANAVPLTNEESAEARKNLRELNKLLSSGSHRSSSLAQELHLP